MAAPLSEVEQAGPAHNVVSDSISREEVQNWLVDQVEQVQQDIRAVNSGTSPAPSIRSCEVGTAHKVTISHQIIPPEAMHAEFDSASSGTTSPCDSIPADGFAAVAVDPATLPQRSLLVRRAAMKRKPLPSPLVCIRDWPNGKRTSYVGAPSEWASALTAALERVDGSFEGLRHGRDGISQTVKDHFTPGLLDGPSEEEVMGGLEGRE